MSGPDREAVLVTEVAAGVFWVEVPGADLRLLCGCPADAVKHLMKRGLIKRRSLRGTTFETGPNAILLSDLPIQGGEFCNLGEFPVLQMLYRQGMILPGHPGNAGRRPLIVGGRDQVAAQLAYIHRGNYGLVSEAELMEAGLTADEARERMRTKRRFAFGRIRQPEELLDTVVVERTPVEVVPGVTIRRQAVNLFEIAYAGQTVTVDLNLAPGQRYDCPYPLGNHNLRREYFAVVHSGDGDGWDTSRPAMSSVLMHQGNIYLIDAGPNLDHVLRSLGVGIHEVEGLFHTHCHDDHFAGLTTLARADHRVKYFATPDVRASVALKLTALTGQHPSAFETYFDVQDLCWDHWNRVDGMEVKPSYSPHPVETSTLTFRVQWGEGYRTYAHLADMASFEVLEAMTTDDPAEPGISPQAAEQVRAGYLEPADLKKLDIGGGMIHGRAEDFSTDLSGKIILAHTALPLTPAQKQVGSGAPFGTLDVLVPALQEYPLRFAHHYLAAYFPMASEHDLRMLLNHPVETFNPETILLRHGRDASNVILIVTGMAEAIGDGIQTAVLTSGALIGELAAITGQPATETVRAISFLRGLILPAGLYRTFIERNRLDAQLLAMADMRAFFNRTWLLSENLSEVIEHRIASASHEITLKAGEELSLAACDRIVLVREGRIERLMDGVVLDHAEAGEFLGSSEVLFNTPQLCRYVAAIDTRALALPGAILNDIPITRWKLLEDHQRRLSHMFAPRAKGPAFPWLPSYALGVEEADKQHQRLFELASEASAACADRDMPGCLDALDRLVAYSVRHFEDEERMLAYWHYPPLAEHHEIHAKLIAEVQAVRDQARASNHLDAEAFHSFFEHWIINHIFSEDSRYARFLADQIGYSI